MGGKRRRFGNNKSTAMKLEDVIDDESLQVCVMGNLQGIKDRRMKKDFEACEGFGGIDKLKKVTALNWGHLTFASQEQKKSTLTAIQGVVFKNKPICFSVRQQKIDRPQKKKARVNAEDIDIQDVVTPLWKMPYEEQLKHKAERIQDSLKEVTKQIYHDSKQSRPKWMESINYNTPCIEYDMTVVPSPTVYNYRNKSSFTAGVDINGKPIFGFALGAVKDNIDCVADPSPCCHISLRSLEIRKVFQEHLDKSDLPVYNKGNHIGFWRRLTVRTFSTGEGLIIIEVDPKDISDERIASEKAALVELCKSSNITESLCYLPFSGLSNFADSDIPIECLLGNPYLHEKLYDLTFRVSPDAFFQVNTKGAEVLYNIISDWCNATKKTTVIDICCGTGSISLCLARSIKNIVGVEMNGAAIKDAELNAKLNNIENAKFIVGKAEDSVPDLLLKPEYKECEEFIAVVDPPRAGLHKNVIRAIRACSFINKIVFVSCDHTNGLVSNGSALCRATSKSSPGIPFKPVKVTAVDMFPHTNSVEVVMLFERENENEKNEETKEEQPESDGRRRRRCWC